MTVPTDKLTNIKYWFTSCSLPTWPINVFLISATLTMAFSAIFHLVFCRDEHTFSLFQRLDYAGISVLIFGSRCFVNLCLYTIRVYNSFIDFFLFVPTVFLIFIMGISVTRFILQYICWLLALQRLSHLPATCPLQCFRYYYFNETTVNV